MTTQIANPDAKYSVSPEALEIAQTYLECHDTKETALALNIEPEKVAYYLRKPNVKRFIDAIFLEQGYMNRGKIQDVMDELFRIKLEEMQESDMGTSKDIMDILTLQHKMRMDEINALAKANPTPIIKQQNNIQQNNGFGQNYDNLLTKLHNAATTEE